MVRLAEHVNRSPKFAPVLGCAVDEVVDAIESHLACCGTAGCALRVKLTKAVTHGWQVLAMSVSFPKSRKAARGRSSLWM